MDRNEDIREMIRTEIQSISVLEERIAFKEMMEGVFLNLYEKNEEMYRALEMRVMDDLAYDINRYRICTGLVERSYLDTTHHYLTAVCDEDIEPSAPADFRNPGGDRGGGKKQSFHRISQRGCSRDKKAVGKGSDLRRRFKGGKRISGVCQIRDMQPLSKKDGGIIPSLYEKWSSVADHQCPVSV